MNIHGPNNPAGPTIPYHLARAYGVQGGASVQRAARPADTQTSGVVSQARVAAGPSDADKLPSPAQRLVAAQVPGRVDFTGDQPAPSAAGTLSMYRHPADKNAAATAVSLGRSLDVRG
jgi:hypothetical protein